jgi:hypothetical protein
MKKIIIKYASQVRVSRLFFFKIQYHPGKNIYPLQISQSRVMDHKGMGIC